jgi:hypothetical protein
MLSLFDFEDDVEYIILARGRVKSILVCKLPRRHLVKVAPSLVA